MAKVEAITQSRLKELLHYDPATGEFVWLVSPANCVPAGSVAGRLSGHGHRQIKISGRQYYAHRLAFLYMTGEWPLDEIDHRNLTKDNNRWTNLRPATRGQNNQNTRPRGFSKYKGVCWHKGHGKWMAQVRFNGKKHYLGDYETEEFAAAAYAAFAAEHFPEFARLT